VLDKIAQTKNHSVATELWNCDGWGLEQEDNRGTCGSVARDRSINLNCGN
jgi:hypothetical protein